MQPYLQRFAAASSLKVHQFKNPHFHTYFENPTTVGKEKKGCIFVEVTAASRLKIINTLEMQHSVLTWWEKQGMCMETFLPYFAELTTASRLKMVMSIKKYSVIQHSVLI